MSKLRRSNPHQLSLKFELMFFFYQHSQYTKVYHCVPCVHFVPQCFAVYLSVKPVHSEPQYITVHHCLSQCTTMHVFTQMHFNSCSTFCFPKMLWVLHYTDSGHANIINHCKIRLKSQLWEGNHLFPWKYWRIFLPVVSSNCTGNSFKMSKVRLSKCWGNGWNIDGHLMCM